MSLSHLNLPIAHQAVLGLVSAATSSVIPAGLAHALANAKPEDIARISQINHVHTLISPVLQQHQSLAEALPRDLCIFFRGMHDANRSRYTAGLTQLAQIGDVLSENGVPAIVLKGGGDIIDPLHDDVAIRFVGDLDILVPEDAAYDAHHALETLGANMVESERTKANPELNWRGQPVPEHHLPMIASDAWQFPVELHTRVGSAFINKLLPRDEVMQRSIPSSVFGIRIMNFEDRACHLLAHSHYHRGDIAVRAWADWTSLRQKCDLNAVRARLCSTGLDDVFVAFQDMADLLESGLSDSTSAVMSPQAQSAISDFAASRSRKLSYWPQLIRRRYLSIKASPEYRRYLLKHVLRPSWWTDVIESHMDKMNRLR